MSSIVGTLPVTHAVDPSGSLTLNLPLQLPQSSFKPELALAYHSASSEQSLLCKGWTLLGTSAIERVPATAVRDGFNGSVNYDENDRFALDGQRLINIDGLTNEYRFEVEQWSRIFALGSDPANPTSWEQYLPDGTIRRFGHTGDSNIKALTGGDSPPTRIWALSESLDPFFNSITFRYINDSDPEGATTLTGGYRIDDITYGGNAGSGGEVITHQRKVAMEYEARTDPVTEYFGGYKIVHDQRMKAITTSYTTRSDNRENNILRYEFIYDEAQVTKLNYLTSIKLTDMINDASLDPLTFGYTGSTPEKVFEETKQIATITDIPIGTIGQIIPLDVNGSGCSDLVVTWRKEGLLAINVYLADITGSISSAPAPGSGSTGLDFSENSIIFPLDLSGDGLTDILHIRGDEETFYLTALLSKPDRSKPEEVNFEKQTEVEFKPVVMSGRFQTGDFSGDGRVGLVYLFAEEDEDGNQLIKFVQFDSDGEKVVEKDVKSGPPIQEEDLEKMRVIVGDLDGNGADDLFLIWPRTDTEPHSWSIFFIESQQGALEYRTDDPLAETGKQVAFVEDSIILPYNADNDSKGGLLFISKDTDSEKLQFQLLRSTGSTLLADSTPTVTDIDYSGNVTVTRITSTNALDIVNVAETDDGPRLHVFRFDSNTFSEVPGTTQPNGIPGQPLIRWADLRGIGRSDCLLNTFDETSGHITVYSMLCSGPTLSPTQWQPLDCIQEFSQTLGYLYRTLYAPMSDRTVYQSNDGVVRSLVNSLADNAASSAVLTGSKDGAQIMRSERAQLVSLPRFVVNETSSRVGQTPIDTPGYSYKNARIDFGGRGWLGFEEITKQNLSVGVQEVNTYYQQFPLVGVVSTLEMKVISTSQTLQLSDFSWVPIKVNDGKNDAIQLVDLRETYYEDVKMAYEVGVVFEYDAWGNTTKTTITSSQDANKPLTIDSTFEEPTEYPRVDSRWVVGNRLTETTIQHTTAEDGTVRDTITLGQIKNEYLSGTNQQTMTSNWVEGDTWLRTDHEYNYVGNPTFIKGPDQHQEFQYDLDTLSVVVMTMTFTRVNGFFIETAEYADVLNLALGLPSTIMKSNYLLNSFKYDALGREIEKSQGTSAEEMTVVEKVSFSAENTRLVETRETLNGLEDVAWRQTVTTYDEAGRPVLVKESKPDDLSTFICRDIDYDNAGRVTARSRPYREGEEPAKIIYWYDVRSRLVTVQYPATQAKASLTRTLTYIYEDREDRNVVFDSVTDGTTTRRVVRKMIMLPNSDTPAGGNFVKSCVVGQDSELNQRITTEFDGLTRPTSITDQNGVKLSLSYDGLSREITRRITSGDDEDEKTLSHFTVTYDDEQRQTTRRNELTGSTVVSTTDHYGRIIKKETAEETIDLTYDNELLSTVVSTNGVSQALTYDSFGNIATSTLTVDNRAFKTTSTWTPMGQLLTTTNPDGSSVTCTPLPDGMTPRELVLANASGAVKASATFSNFDNAFSRPSTSVLGSGDNALTSQYTFAPDGLFTDNTVTKDSTTLLQQTWEYDAFKQVSKYSVTQAGPKEYTYDLANQLTQVSLGDGSEITNFAYDSSGNLSEYAGLSFTNDGWQISTVKNPDDSIAYTFQYSDDGNRTSKEDGSGSVVDTMTYDSEGRLTRLNETTFLYDPAGRLVKAISVEGSTTKTTIYVSDSYEVDITITETDDDPVSQEVQTSYLTHEHRLASLSINDANEEVRYYHHDHLGSVIGVSSGDGEMITSYEYNAFGKVTVTGDDVSRYKYSGKQLFDSIYYFGARFYDPDTGRFLTLDNYPLDLDSVSPASFNMYTFSRNDPINYLDPDGNDSLRWWHWVGIGLMVGGVVLLCLVPGAGLVGAGAVAATVFGNAALGAGFSAFFTDYDSNDPGSWWLQVGLGAGFGAAGGYLGPVLGKGIGKGVGMAVKKLVPASLTQRAAQVGGGRATSLAGKLATKTAGETLAGGALGGAQQLTTNFWNDREKLGDWNYWKSGNWLNGVWDSATLGIYGGAGLSVAARGATNASKAINRIIQLRRARRAATRLLASVRLNSLAAASRNRNIRRAPLAILDENIL